MTPRRKKVLFITTGVITLVVAITLAVLLEIKAFKPQIEAAASHAVGMDVRINGRMGITFTPGFALSMKDVSVRNKGVDVAAVEKMTIRLELIPLMRGEVRILGVAFVKPVISLVRYRNGTFNFERPGPAPSGKPLAVPALSLSKGTIVFTDKITGEKIEAEGADLTLRKLLYSGSDTAEPFRNISFTGDVKLRTLKINNFALTNIEMKLTGGKGVFDISPVTMGIFGGHGKGSMHVDVTGAAPRYRIFCTLSQFRIEDLIREFSPKNIPVKTIEGLTDFSADLTARGKSMAAVIRNISFTGDIKCRTLKINNVALANVVMKITGRKGVFDISPVTMSIFGGHGKGSMHVDVTGAAPRYRVICTLSRFRIEELIGKFSPKNIPAKTIEGLTDFSADLTARGKSMAAVKRSLNGDVSLKGENLMLYGIDIDALMAKFERSQNFNLVDLGAFFLAGPFGPALTKSYNFGNLYEQLGEGKGSIKKLVSIWEVKKGIAGATDVALASNKNRIAMKGGLDFINDRFVDVTVAVLDKRGCAVYSQKVQGPFSKPRIDKVSVLESISGSVLNALGDAWKLIQGKECTAFYSGSVAQPE